MTDYCTNYENAVVNTDIENLTSDPKGSVFLIRNSNTPFEKSPQSRMVDAFSTVVIIGHLKD